MAHVGSEHLAAVMELGAAGCGDARDGETVFEKRPRLLWATRRAALLQSSQHRVPRRGQCRYMSHSPSPTSLKASNKGTAPEECQSNSRFCNSVLSCRIGL